MSSRPSQAWFLDENIGKHKLIKVKITEAVSRFIIGPNYYYPGDICEVPEENFQPNFMEKVEEPKPIVQEEPAEETVEVAAEPAETVAEPIEEKPVIAKVTPKERRRRKPT